MSGIGLSNARPRIIDKTRLHPRFGFGIRPSNVKLAAEYPRAAVPWEFPEPARGRILYQCGDSRGPVVHSLDKGDKPALPRGNDAPTSPSLHPAAAIRRRDRLDGLNRRVRGDLLESLCWSVRQGWPIRRGRTHEKSPNSADATLGQVRGEKRRSGSVAFGGRRPAEEIDWAGAAWDVCRGKIAALIATPAGVQGSCATPCQLRNVWEAIPA